MATCYDKISALNWSTLKHMERSPLAFRAAADARDRSETPARRLGTLVHCIVLEPERYKDRYVLCSADRRTKIGKAIVAEAGADGKTVLAPDEYNTAERMATAVFDHPIAGSRIGMADTEITLTWDANGVACKGRADAIDNRQLIDLKTARSIVPREFFGAVARYRYHAQLAWYMTGARAAGLIAGDTPPLIVAVESSYPHDVMVVEIPREVVALGEQLCDRLLTRYVECMESGEWPGAAPGIVELEMPTWAWTESSW